MDDKNFTVTVMAIFASLTAIVVAVNFWIDPLWHYAHAHLFNDVQMVTDEREQKTANQKYQPKDADTLLIGSSRSTYIHTTAFEDWDIYNYSVANLSMREYRTMIEYAFEKNPDYERIVLGVDFFKSSTQEAEAPKDITNHVARTEKSFYRTKNLLSLDVFETSLKNLRLSAANEISEDRLYNREGNAFARRLSDAEIAADTAEKIALFEESFYGHHYVYYPRYKEIMGIVRDTMPDVEKVVYTTPISTELFKSLVRTGLYDDYEVWLRDLVDVYGGVWNFMYPNLVTNDITNYFDGHHFYPEIGNLIAARVEQGEDAAVPADFGVYVTGENIDVHLEEVRGLVDELELE